VVEVVVRGPVITGIALGRRRYQGSLWGQMGTTGDRWGPLGTTGPTAGVPGDCMMVKPSDGIVRVENC